MYRMEDFCPCFKIQPQWKTSHNLMCELPLPDANKKSPGPKKTTHNLGISTIEDNDLLHKGLHKGNKGLANICTELINFNKISNFFITLKGFIRNQRTLCKETVLISAILIKDIYFCLLNE